MRGAEDINSGKVFIQARLVRGSREGIDEVEEEEVEVVEGDEEEEEDREEHKRTIKRRKNRSMKWSWKVDEEESVKRRKGNEMIEGGGRE